MTKYSLFLNCHGDCNQVEPNSSYMQQPGNLAVCPNRSGGKAMEEFLWCWGRGVRLRPICHFIPELSRQGSVNFPT